MTGSRNKVVRLRPPIEPALADDDRDERRRGLRLARGQEQGFIDAIPREYEDAAMVDGYTRLQAF